MPLLTTDDGVKLHYEEVGSGAPLIFVHEFAGDWRSWEPQVRHFGRRYRCIAYNARGFTPSDVPDDVREILAGPRARRHQGGARCARRSTRRTSSACRWADLRRCISASPIPSARCRWSSAAAATAHPPDKRAQFAEETEAAARRFEEVGMSKAAVGYALAPSRVQFQNKDPRGWQEFADQLAGNSTSGAALTMRGVQKRTAVAVRPGRSHEDHHRADARS